LEMSEIHYPEKKVLLFPPVLEVFS